MATAKLVLIFPRPQDEDAFERAYRDVHMPMIEKKFKGVNRFVSTKITGSPQGKTRTYRIAEVHFSQMSTLLDCVGTPAYQEVIDHATAISTGGTPIVLVCEDENFLYW